MLPCLGHGILRGQADQAAWILHLVHHGVAGVYAQAAANALVLQPVADVDTHGADLHAELAVDAVAQTFGLVVNALLARTAPLAALCVVADDHGVLVEHGALKTCIGAHVFADLLAHIAGIAIGGKTIEQHPENLPVATQGQQLDTQFTDGHEIAHEGETGPQGQGDPEELLERLLPDLLESPAALVDAHTGTAIAFDLALDPDKNLGINGLRTGETAPQTPCDRRKQEKRQRADDEKTAQINEILRVKHQPEQVKATRFKIEEQHLALAPLQPGHAVEEQLREKHHDPSPAREHATDGPGVDLLLGSKQRHIVRTAVLGFGCDRDDLARFAWLAGHRSSFIFL